MNHWTMLLIGLGVFALLVLLQAIVRAAHPVQRAIGGIVMGLCALVAVNFYRGLHPTQPPGDRGVRRSGNPRGDALAFAKPDLCIGKKDCQPFQKWMMLNEGPEHPELYFEGITAYLDFSTGM